MAGTRGTFQGNLQGTPSRPLEMLTSSKAVTASYALTASRFETASVGGPSQSVYVSDGKLVATTSTIGSKTKPVYVSGGKFSPADDIPTSKTGSWENAAAWLAANSGSITGLTGSAADLGADVVLLVGKSASWDNSSTWVGANSASLLNRTSSLTISESLGTPAAANVQYTPGGGNKSITIKVPSTPAHIGAAPASHTHSISDVTGLSNISSSVVRLESSASAIKTEVAKYVTTQSFNAYTSSAAAAVADAYLPLAGGTITGDLVVNQNLTVKGTTVSIDATNLNVKDKLILVASGSTTQAAADGAGMAVATASAGEGGAARIQYESAGNRFTSSVNFAAPGFTGSLRGNVVGNVTGTASFATSASKAISASYANNATSASYAVNSTNAISASEAAHAVTASWALDSKHANTASIALLANSATSASYATSASNATNAANATSASYANNSTTASYALVAETVKGGVTVTSASEATHAISASHAAEVQWNGVTNRPSFYSASFQAGAFSAKTYGPTSGSQTINIPTTTTHITGLNAITASVKQMVAKSGSWDGVASTASAAYTQAVEAYASASLAKKEAESASYWKTEASKSAAAAASSATAASGSAVSAATYANQSSTSAQLAAASASAAHTYKTRAAASASAAHTSKTLAAASASAASQSAYQAAVYAVSASASNTTIQQLAANVKQYYDNTTASAAQAATSATNAGTSATNAANAATRAGASASAASQSAYQASASAALLFKATGSATQPVYMTANGPTPANAYDTLFTNLVETKNVLTASVGGTTKYATINSASYANNSTTASYALVAESLKAGGSLVVDTASYAKTSSVAHTASFALDHYTPSTTALTPTSSVGNSAARTYIKTLTLDKNKHVVGFTTGSETVTNTDTKVTAVGNHYKATGQISGSVGGATKLVTGFTLDAAGHVTAASTVDSSSIKVTSASYAVNATSAASATSASRATSAASADSATSASRATSAASADNASKLNGQAASYYATATATSNAAATASAANTEAAALRTIITNNSASWAQDNDTKVTSADNHYGPTKAGTSGSSTSRYYIKTIDVDAKGHVTGVTTGNETVTNTDTKVTSVANHYKASGQISGSIGSATKVITNFTLDAAGHVTAATSVDSSSLKVTSASYANNSTTASYALVAESVKDGAGLLVNTASFALDHYKPTTATGSAIGTTAARTYIKAINVDKNNHVISVTTGSETVTNTDTKVTAVGNHYTPAQSTGKAASAGSVISGLGLDAKGHVVAVTGSNSITSASRATSAATADNATKLNGQAASYYAAASTLNNVYASQSNYLPLTGGTVTGDLTVQGNAIFNGTASFINTTDIVVKDRLILLASGSANTASANGAGIAIQTASATTIAAAEGAAARIQYLSAGNKFTSSVRFEAPQISATGFTGSFNGKATSAGTADVATGLGNANNTSASVAAAIAAKWTYNENTIKGVKVTSASRADSAASATTATTASYNAAGASALAWVTANSTSALTNTDRYVNTAAFASTGSSGSLGVKMTLTRAGSDTATVTATIPVANATAAGVVTAAQVNSWNGAATNSHTHSNKALLDSLTNAKTGSWDGKWTYNENTIKGVKVTSASRADSAASATSATTAATASFITWANVSGKPSTFTPAAHNHNLLVTEGDYRATASTPNDYSNNLKFRGLKNLSTIGLTATGSYAYLVGLRGWSDSSGGDSHELAFANDGIYTRHGATTAWGNWAKVITSDVTGSWATAAANSHTHTNKAVLDGITAAKTASWDAKTSNTGSVTSVTVTTASNYVTVDNAAAITTSGTRKIDLSAATKGKIESGSTAFGWGNHANAGYLKSTGTIATASYNAAGSTALAWITANSTSALLNTDTKVTAVGNHYAPTASTEIAASITGSAGAFATNTEYTVITGIKAKVDAKGHVTDIKYTAQKVKDTTVANTDRYVNTASFASTGSSGANGVKMTLTRAGSDTATVVATIPVASTSAAGVMTGAQVTNLNSAIASASVAKTAMNWITANSASVHTHSNKAVLDGITAAKTASWDTAYGWGNHASAGYVKSSGVTSVTITTASTYVTVDNAAAVTSTGTRKIDLAATTKNKIESGSVAFGWGNHASAGYVKSSGVTSVTITTASNYVSVDSASAITSTGTRKIDLTAATKGKIESGSVAFGWGNHASAGYVKSSGVTSIATGTGLTGGPITSTGTMSIAAATLGKIESGSTAFGWGNHASAGYVKSSGVTSYTLTTASTYVTVDNAAAVTSTGTRKIDLATKSKNAIDWVIANSGSAATAITNNHTHSNKALLDSLTNAKTGSWDGKWTYNEATIKAVKVNSATAADSATNATNATTAVKLAGTSGSVGIPVYINAGVPTACNANIVALPLSSSGVTTGTLTLVPGKVHKCGTLTGNLTLALGTDNTYTHEAIYCCTFNMGATVRTITLPSGVKVMQNSMDLDTPNCDYEINIMNNVAVIARTEES